MAKSYNTTALMNAVKSNDTCALQSVIASATEHVEEISSREDHDCSCEPLKHAQVVSLPQIKLLYISCIYF